MVLTDRLLRFAAGRPHVLVVAAVGATEVRLAVERELRQLGWPIAATPAGANVLVDCGADGALAVFVERTWAALGAPRSRVTVATAADAETRLREGQRRLAAPAQEAPRSTGATWHHKTAVMHQHGHEHNHDPEDGGDRHSHGMSESEMPAGLPMPGRADDRDGLKLDQLHVPLGPVLPHWPAGLVVHATVQGDVIQDVMLETVAAPPTSGLPFWDEPWLRAAAGEPISRGLAERRRAAAHLDSLARLLAVAGWDDAVVQAQRLRDDLLDAVPARDAQREGMRLARRLRRARALRWLTDGLGVLEREDARSAGVTGPAWRAAGDVTVRWQGWLQETVSALCRLDERTQLDPHELEGPRGRLDGDVAPSAALLAVLPRLLEGRELAGARLIVASLDPDLDELRHDRWTAARR